MKIKKYFLTKNDKTRRMEKIENVNYIIITSSKYKGFSSLKNRNIIEMSKYKEEREFSCNYIIGCSGEVVNIIPENERAICTRIEEIDRESISIMLCIDKEGNYTDTQLKKLKELIQEFLEKYDIPKENVLMEYDINNSRRPVNIVDEPIILYDMLNNKISKVKL
jgi:N-acetyl-anhydromuramyl-L-alanine amidase AmpD